MRKSAMPTFSATQTMPDRLTWPQLKELAAHRTAPAVSLYLPTRRSAGETLEGPTRLKNALSTIDRLLQGRSEQDAAAVARQLREARLLVDDASFWRSQSEGLAFFMSPEMFRLCRSPIPFVEATLVGNFFHITPAIPAVEAGDFFILALSKKQVRFLQANRYHAREAALPGAPASLEELFFDRDTDQHLQLHTVGHDEGAGPRHAAKFHGQTDEQEPWRERTLHYLRAIDAAVGRATVGADGPLVFAGDVGLWPMYRQISRHPRLLDDFVRGNPELLSPQVLQDRAWPIVYKSFVSFRKHVTDVVALALAKGKGSASLEEIVTGSAVSRVEVLLLASGRNEWGRFDARANRVRLAGRFEPGCEDLLNVAACQTLSTGGRTYLCEPEEMPGGATAAAMLRF